MGETTIEWTQRPGTVGRTWNVCRGCSYKSPGCKNCYAARIAGRFSGKGRAFEGLVTIRPRKDGGTRHPETDQQVLGSKAFWNGEVRFVIEKLLDPLRWKNPSTIFANSMSDMFHDGFTNDQIGAMYGVAYLCERHTFQFLTKRPERRRAWMAWVADMAKQIGIPIATYCLVLLRSLFETLSFEDKSEFRDRGLKLIDKAYGHLPRPLNSRSLPVWPLPNVWEGVSVETDKESDRIHELLATPAAVRFLSLEPLLGPVDLTPFLDPTGACDCSYEHGHHCKPFCAKDAPWRRTGVPDQVMVDPVSLAISPATEDDIERGLSVPFPTDPTIDWVIIGCESGPGMRACDPDWIRTILEDCTEHGVARFLKQARESKPSSIKGAGIRKGKRSARKGNHGGVITLPYLDGKQYAEYPT